MATDRKRLNCAIYTRKSSEEGLEQEFNSLHAQREACEAFVQSQKHEGWKAIRSRYDDGGFSGGTMDRPGLEKLLSDIEAGRVQVVVVYKVDRLTRSLADFAKIIETFDAHGVSFVSVTQQFNTTTSMGRLTLNVLLSFAQFEREVTGERIRDKIAASKKKGMWMGGNPPMGYDCEDRKLVVVEREAETVRHIFRRYAKLGCVRRLKDELDTDGIVSKVRVFKNDRRVGGVSLSRGALYHLLQNRIYLGEIVHKGESYHGEHDAIVDRELWDRVQERLAANRTTRKSGANAREPSLLAGLLFDADDRRLAPSHAGKGAKRYRYYVNEAIRLPAREIENAVLAGLRRHLASERLLPDGSPIEDRECLDYFRSSVSKVVLGQAEIQIHPNEPDQADAPCLSVPFTLRRRGVETKLILDPVVHPRQALLDPTLIKAVARAYVWNRKLMTGEVKSIKALSREAGLTRPYVKRLLKLAFLSPDIVETILAGCQPADLTAELLTRLSFLPRNWEEQRIALRLKRSVIFPTKKPKQNQRQISVREEI